MRSGDWPCLLTELIVTSPTQRTFHVPNSGRIVLPRNDRLQGQIVGLERRTSAVGRDTISHPDRGHDDVANAVAGAAALSKFGGYDTSMRWVSGDDDGTAKTPALIGI